MERERTTGRILLRGIVTLTVGIIALSVITTLGFLQLQDQAVTQQTQELSLIESCQRLNILRREDNLSHLADYTVFKFVYETSVPPPHATARQKRLSKEFVAKLRTAISEKSWTPATDCGRAVNLHGAAYRAPTPIPFTRQLPARSALP